MVRSPMFKTQHAGLCSQGAGPLDRDNIISTRHVPTCAKARMAMSQIDCPDIRWTGCPEVWLPADLPGGRSWGRPRWGSRQGNCRLCGVCGVCTTLAGVPIGTPGPYFSRDCSFLMPPWWRGCADVTCAGACPGAGGCSEWQREPGGVVSTSSGKYRIGPD
jgi:hypothetical protein